MGISSSIIHTSSLQNMSTHMGAQQGYNYCALEKSKVPLYNFSPKVSNGTGNALPQRKCISGHQKGLLCTKATLCLCDSTFPCLRSPFYPLFFHKEHSVSTVKKTLV